MGTHKGWLVTTLQNGSFWARARDPQAGRYQGKCFKTLGEAKRWAKEQHALFLTRMESLALVDVPDLVRRYLLNLERRGRNPRHCEEVSRVLGEFAAIVPDLGQVNVAARIGDWLASHRHLAPPTRNRYLAHAKALTAWALAHGEIRTDPLAAVERVKEPSTVKAVFTLDELRRLASADADPYFLRFALMLYAGLRCSEAHNLHGTDLDLTGRVLLVRQGKGAKDRLVPIQDELAPLIAPLAGTGPIFDARLQRLSTKQHGRDLAAFTARQGIAIGERSPHSLRHTYAGLMTATGVPSIMLAAWMGHVSMATTAGYAQMAMRFHAVASKWRPANFLLRG